MSRYIEVNHNTKTIRERVVSMDECKHMCNDVCCNPDSAKVAEFADKEWCTEKRCAWFEKEDGIVQSAAGN